MYIADIKGIRFQLFYGWVYLPTHLIPRNYNTLQLTAKLESELSEN